jgi:NUDIX domain.
MGNKERRSYACRIFTTPMPEVMTAEFSVLHAPLLDYLVRHPEEADSTATFLDFLASSGQIFERSHAPGHFTGSAWLVSADGARVLLMHHRKLDRWLQPGGHADGETQLASVALREAGEETGVPCLHIEGGIFDLDRHRIPAREHEPAHWHYDVRYVVRCGADEHFTPNQESRALAWRPVQEVAQDESLDGSLRQMARKWLARAAHDGAACG